MARVDDLAQFAQDYHDRQKEGLTINDLLMTCGYTDPAMYSSAKSQLGRALKPGGSYRALAESGIIRPSVKSGRIAEWEVGLPRFPDKQELKLESRALAPVRNMNISNYPTELRNTVRTVVATNLTGRKGIAVSDMIREFDHNLELERVKREAAEDRLRSEKEVSAEYKSMVETLREFIKSTGGASVVPAK